MRRAIGAAAAAGLLVLAPLQAAAPVTAWVNGHWFDGTRFREVTVYSDGERLTLKRPAAISLTVDLGSASSPARLQSRTTTTSPVSTPRHQCELTWTRGSSTS